MRTLKPGLALALCATIGLSAACSSSSSSTAGGSASGSRSQGLRARMTSDQVVTPSNEPSAPGQALASASGTFTGTLDRRTGALTWTIRYDGIGVETASAADIHRGQPGEFGAVMVRLCGPCKAAGQAGRATLASRDARDVASGKAWVTVLTPDHPNGVIRGQIVAKRTT